MVSDSTQTPTIATMVMFSQAMDAVPLVQLRQLISELVEPPQLQILALTYVEMESPLWLLQTTAMTATLHLEMVVALLVLSK